MADYRQIQTKFWTDPYTENLTFAEKSFYLYLLTNDHVSVSGIYQITEKTIRHETDANIKLIKDTLFLLEKDGKILYLDNVLWIKNFYKYNSWASSKVQIRITSDVSMIPDGVVKTEYLKYFSVLYPDLFQYCTNTLSIPYIETENTLSETENTFPLLNIHNNTETETINAQVVGNIITEKSQSDSKLKPKKEIPKKEYGEFNNVRLTDEEFEKLKNLFPDSWKDWIERLSCWKKSKNKATASDYATIRNWTRREAAEKPQEKSGDQKWERM